MVDKEKEVIQWDNWLLEAVRKIRTQKQRPGLDRIYNAVRLLAEKHELAEHSQKSPIAPIYHVQFNQIKIEQVQRHLDRAVRKGLLLKVYSKGQATYKAVEKSERTLNLAKEQIGDNGNGGEISKCILKVIRELSECDAPVPTSSSVTVSSLSKPPKLGYTFDTIEEYIRHSHVIIYPDDSQPDFLPNLVRQALSKECSRGKLELCGEYYRLPPEKQASASQGSGSSGGSKTKTSTSTNPTSISSSSNSNSSWSSNTSCNTPVTPVSVVPTNFSEISSSVSSKVKSATATSSSTVASASVSPGSSVVKKDGSGGSSSGAGSVSASSGKAGRKDGGSPHSSVTPPSPPRGNLAGDLLTEAEEIALVTEQTARAVMLVMKDRRPGEKPLQRKSPPADASVSQQLTPVLPASATPSPLSLPKSDSDTEKKVGSRSPSSDEDSSGNVASRGSSVSGESIGSNSSSGQSGKSGTSGNKASAIIKLMVPSFPGRNGNGKNGNGNGSSTTAVVNPSGTTSSTSKPPSPSLEKGLAPQPPANVTPSASKPEPDKNMITSSGNTRTSTPSPTGVTKSNDDISPGVSAPSQQLVSTASPATTKAANVSSGAMSISSIASAIMNKRAFLKQSNNHNNGDAKSKQPLTVKGQCMICGGTPVTKIVRNISFVKMVQLFFTVIPKMDAKPDLCKDVDLCNTCFDKLVEFSATEEVLQYLESVATLTRIELMRKMLSSDPNGITSSEDFEPASIREAVKQKYMKNIAFLNAEEENANIINNSYQSSTSVTQTGKLHPF